MGLDSHWSVSSHHTQLEVWMIVEIDALIPVLSEYSLALHVYLAGKLHAGHGTHCQFQPARPVLASRGLSLNYVTDLKMAFGFCAGQFEKCMAASASETTNGNVRP